MQPNSKREFYQEKLVQLKRARAQQGALIEGTSEEAFYDLLRGLTSKQLKEVVEERSVVEICGLPTCTKPSKYHTTPSVHQKQKTIQKGEVVDAQDFYIFCGATCFWDMQEVYALVESGTIPERKKPLSSRQSKVMSEFVMERTMGEEGVEELEMEVIEDRKVEIEVVDSVSKMDPVKVVEHVDPIKVVERKNVVELKKVVEHKNGASSKAPHKKQKKSSAFKQKQGGKKKKVKDSIGPPIEPTQDRPSVSFVPDVPTPEVKVHEAISSDEEDEGFAGLLDLTTLKEDIRSTQFTVFMRVRISILVFV